MAVVRRNTPAFSKVLYCVPLETLASDGTVLTEAGAAVVPGVLDGTVTPVPPSTPAAGTSANSRYFIPVNGPDEQDAGAIDYGTSLQNQQAQRAECDELLGERPAADPGPDGTIIIAEAVYANP